MYLSCIQLCKAIPCFFYRIGSSQVANIPFYPRSSIQRRHQRRHRHAEGWYLEPYLSLVILSFLLPLSSIPLFPCSPFSGQAKALAAMDANEILDQGSPGPASSKNKMHPLIKVSRKLPTCFVKVLGFLKFVGTLFE